MLCSWNERRRNYQLIHDPIVTGIPETAETQLIGATNSTVGLEDFLSIHPRGIVKNFENFF